jgi:hypothetical protein
MLLVEIDFNGQKLLFTVDETVGNTSTTGALSVKTVMSAPSICEAEIDLYIESQVNYADIDIDQS